MRTGTEYRWKLIREYVEKALELGYSSDERWDVISRDNNHIRKKLRELENTHERR